MKTTYEIDPAHASAQFSIRHMMIANVRGGFRKIKGTVVIDPENIGASTVEATIDVNSIATFDERRDEHLKSADFLDAGNYPTMTFKSTKVEADGSDEAKVTGNLTIHGVTKEVVLKVEGPTPETRDPYGNIRIGASASTKIRRSDFGLTWNAVLEAGGIMVGEDLEDRAGCPDDQSRHHRRLTIPMSKTEYVTLSVSDRTAMRAYVSHPSGAPKAGLIVFQEAFGVNPHIRDVTDRFAREGYLAIAPELFHRTAPGFEAGYGDFPSCMPHMQALRDPQLEADMHATFDWLKNNGQGSKESLTISAVGYCMGGRCACLAAIALPLGCGVSYYGGGIAGLTDRLTSLQSPMMFFWGGLDHHIGPDQVQAVNTAMRETKKPYVNVEFSFADHGFFCDARPSYNAEAAAEAWALTLEFLARHVPLAVSPPVP